MYEPERTGQSLLYLARTFSIDSLERFYEY